MSDTEQDTSEIETVCPPEILEYDTEYEIGQDNVEMMGLDIHNPVFFLSAGIVLVFSVLTLIFPLQTGELLNSLKTSTLHTFDWLFAATPVALLIFAVGLCVSPLGRIRLGGQEATPEFNIASWVAMLFAAGVGVGFMFWGAAEPLAYYTDWFGTPLNVEAHTPRAERLSFSATLFHWGLAPWAIYAVAGLALGFFAHNKGLPLSIRSAFYPLLGERVWSWPGHIIDLFAVVSTVFGLATTIGLGATQAANGIAYILGWTPSIWMQILLICSMTGLAVISVLRGMDGGVKLLSDINMGVAFAILLFVIIAGPTVLIFTGMGENLLSYVLDTPALTQWWDREDDIGFFYDWTIFYWAWWISWSPFVGMFIARVSRGRTIRDFLLGVLLMPLIVVTVWFSTFGETAISLVQSGVERLSSGEVPTELMLFEVLRELPFSFYSSLVAIVLLIVFFVTSSDSGSLVVDSITAGGKLHAPVPQRIFWASMEGLVAIALLVGGGTTALSSLQAGAISAGLPFGVVLLVSCFSLFQGLRHELNIPTEANLPSQASSGPK